AAAGGRPVVGGRHGCVGCAAGQLVWPPACRRAAGLRSVVMNRLADPAPLPIPAAPDSDPAGLAATLMQARQTLLPKRLLAPGPDPRQLDMILRAAATAPDHGQLQPWRLVLVPQAARPQLAEVFGAALMQRDA